MDGQQDYSDLLLVTEDGQRIEWIEYEARKYAPSLISNEYRRWMESQLQLATSVPFHSKVVTFVRDVAKGKPITGRSFLELEMILKGLKKFPREEYRPFEMVIFEQFMTSLKNYNCIGIWKLAMDHRSSAEYHIREYICEHLMGMIENDNIDIQFYRLSKEYLDAILSDNRLVLMRELDIVTVINKWIDALPSERQHHLPSLLNNLRIMGLPSDLQEIREVDVRSLTLSRREPRHCKDQLWVIGGWHADGPKDTIEYFDVVDYCWKTHWLTFHYPIAYHAVQILNDELYVFGGNDNHRKSYKKMMKFSNGKWQRMGDMQEPRCYISNSSCVYNNRIYVFGGYNHTCDAILDANGHIIKPTSRLNTCEYYDPDTNSWNPLPRMPHGRSDFACVVLKDRIYLIGGFGGQGPLDNVEIFDPATFSYTHIDTLPNPRTGLSAYVHGNNIHVVGGFDGIWRLSSTVTLNTRSNTWRPHEHPNMINTRSNFVCHRVGREVIAVAGYSQSVIDICEVFSNGHWKLLPSVALPRSALAAVVVPPNVIKKLSSRPDNYNKSSPKSRKH